MIPPLVHHLESHLGSILGGWSQDADGIALPFQVVHLEKTPIVGAHVLATLGLSSSALRLGHNSRTIREELIIMFHGRDGPGALPAILQDVAKDALRENRALNR